MLRQASHRGIAASLIAWAMSENLQQEVRTLQELRDTLDQENYELASENTDLIATSDRLHFTIEVLREENRELLIDHDDMSWRNEQLVQRLLAINNRWVCGEIVEAQDGHLVPPPPPNTPPPLRVGVEPASGAEPASPAAVAKLQEDIQILMNEKHTLRETLHQARRTHPTREQLIDGVQPAVLKLNHPPQSPTLEKALKKLSLDEGSTTPSETHHNRSGFANAFVLVWKYSRVFVVTCSNGVIT